MEYFKNGDNSFLLTSIFSCDKFILIGVNYLIELGGFMEIFLQGLLMGLAYVAPIGLQNLFVINTALTQPKKRILFTVLVVIFFDITLALACFFGIGMIMEKAQLLKLLVLLFGSVIIIYIGLGLLKSKSVLEKKDVNMPIVKMITSACVVTWFNPQAIIDGSLMLGAFRATLSSTEATEFILGVIIASCLWFSGISLFICLFSNKFNNTTLKIINIICGFIIIFYGCKLLYNFGEIVYYTNKDNIIIFFNHLKHDWWERF